MKGYIVCVYEVVKDKDALKNYALKAKEAVEKHSGKFLIRGGKKITTEGNKFVRTAVIEFSSFDQAKKFFYSTYGFRSLGWFISIFKTAYYGWS